MKRVMLLILSVFCLFTLSVTASAFDESEKIYISENDLFESEEGDFFVQFDDTLYAVDAVYDDEYGLYVMEAGVEPGVPPYVMINCPCCGREQSRNDLAKYKNKCKFCRKNVYTCR